MIRRDFDARRTLSARHTSSTLLLPPPIFSPYFDKAALAHSKFLLRAFGYAFSSANSALLFRHLLLLFIAFADDD